MGGSLSYKGNNVGQGHRGRGYGIMLLMAFGAALIGVMALHKFRERRIFNLISHDKDRQLLSLHLLLQKERESTKEIQRKSGEMKAKLYTLRNKKMELDRRLLEMQSTIDSLKEEQRIMESALEEKLNEIKMLSEKDIDTGKENPQVIALTHSLKQKEAEIQDLKRRLEYPVKVWSVSTDDPSNPPVNLTVNGNIVQYDKAEGGEDKDEDRQSSEFVNYKDDENSRRGEDGGENESADLEEGEDEATGEAEGENRVGSTYRKEQFQKIEIIQDQNVRDVDAADEKGVNESELKRNEDSPNGEGFGVGDKKNIANETEVFVETRGKVWNSRDEDTHGNAMDGKEHKINTDGQMGTLESSQDGNGVISKGGMKIEMPDSSRNGAAPRVKGKHGYLSRTKGKRWRLIAKNRLMENGRISENRGSASIITRRLSKNYQDGLKTREDGASNVGKLREGGEMDENNTSHARKIVDSSDSKLLKSQNPEDATQQVEKVHIMFENPHLDGVLTNTSVNGETSNITSEFRKQKLDEVRQSEDQDVSGIQHNISSIDINKVESSTEQVKVVDKHVVAEEMEEADVHESETDAVSGDFFEDDKEEDEEIDESEF